MNDSMQQKFENVETHTCLSTYAVFPLPLSAITNDVFYEL